MRHYNYIPILSALFCIVTGCKNKVDNICIDVNDIEHVAVDSANILKLEASDSSLLYDINGLEVTDSALIVRSRDYLRKYHLITGRFLGNIGVFGRDSAQYSVISDLWMKNDTVCVYDSNNNAVKYYSLAGSYLSSKPCIASPELPGEHPRQLVSSARADGSFYTLNSFSDYTTPTNPKMTLYDAKGHRIGAVKGREVNEATYFSDAAFCDKDHGRVLSWEPFRDTIYSVTDLEIKPLYAINFGKASFPSECQNKEGISRKAQAFKDCPLPTASFVRCVQAVDGWIYFTFALNDGQFNIVAYNETSRKSKAFHFADKDGSLQQTSFFKIYGDTIYMELSLHYS